MSVNLTELGAALGMGTDCRKDRTGVVLHQRLAVADTRYIEVVEAVLDAPRIWWCFKFEMISKPYDGDCFACVGRGEGCGWVVLVPVEGEGR